MGSVSRVPRCWRFEQWPERDQQLWLQGCLPGDPFADDGEHGGYAHGLREGSRVKTMKGNGRWLDFLDSRGWLDPREEPLDRVTRPRLRAYFRALRREGNADGTVIGRFQELTMAMKIMAPGKDVSWIRRPDGITIYALLRRRQRVLLVPDGKVLFDWGVTMMDEAAERARESEQLAAFRDGLLIAVLAACGRRLRSLALLRIGHEVVRRDRCFRIELEPEQVKTHKADCFDLPETLTPYLQHYLDAIRPALLGPQRDDIFWVTTNGTPMGEGGIQSRILRLSRKRFGVAFGPHRFRHAIITTAALRIPSNPGLGSDVVGNSPATAEEHYNRSGQCQVGPRYADLLEQRLLASKRGGAHRRPA